MNVLAIIVLFAVSLECISAARRRVVYAPPPTPPAPLQNTHVEKLPSSINSGKGNPIPRGSTSSNGPPIAKQNSRNSIDRLPSLKTDQPQLPNDVNGLRRIRRQSQKHSFSSEGPQKTSTENSIVSVPYLEKGKETIVKGKNGKIFVDDVFLFDFDDKLKDGKFRFRVNEANDVFVNDRLVLRKRPEDKLIIPVDPKIVESGITEFKVRVDEYGYLHYTSNKGVSKIFAAGK